MWMRSLRVDRDSMSVSWQFIELCVIESNCVSLRRNRRTDAGLEYYFVYIILNVQRSGDIVYKNKVWWSGFDMTKLQTLYHIGDKSKQCDLWNESFIVMSKDPTPKMSGYFNELVVFGAVRLCHKCNP